MQYNQDYPTGNAKLGEFSNEKKILLYNESDFLAVYGCRLFGQLVV